MKFLPLILIFLFNTLNANELRDAYEKEFAFLKAQKTELQKRVVKEKRHNNKEVLLAKKDVKMLQTTLVSLSEKEEKIRTQIDKSSQLLDDKQSNKEITASVLIQVKSLLQEYNISLNNSTNTSVVAVMQKAFDDTATLYKKLSSLQKEDGKFYLLDGTTQKGSIIKVGNIAAYGLSSKAKGALAPAGNGEYKIWNQNASTDALAFANNTPKREIKIFIYENLDKDVEYIKEKTLQDTLKGGGVIGYIILALGLLGLLLILIRTVLLSKSGSNVKEITAIVVKKVQENKADEALEAIKGFKGSTARIIKATLRNITKDRDHIEDIITENILNESSNIDRFGNFVLVLAAVAPLLGLLGTVTGMIATFDIITEFGTSDPKLLSGGISEALVTTMLGLIVAIPLLLLGNLLSGWAQNIKDSMEQAALHIVNLFELNKAK
ncbi:MotA/TolQ/ExbB proton channel family protein [Sulfurimonas sp.]